MSHNLDEIFCQNIYDQEDTFDQQLCWNILSYVTVYTMSKNNTSDFQANMLISNLHKGCPTKKAYWQMGSYFRERDCWAYKLVLQGHRKGRTFINWLGNIKNWVLDQIWCIFLHIIKIWMNAKFLSEISVYDFNMANKQKFKG